MGSNADKPEKKFVSDFTTQYFNDMKANISNKKIVDKIIGGNNVHITSTFDIDPKVILRGGNFGTLMSKINPNKPQNMAYDIPSDYDMPPPNLPQIPQTRVDNTANVQDFVSTLKYEQPGGLEKINEENDQRENNDDIELMVPDYDSQFVGGNCYDNDYEEQYDDYEEQKLDGEYDDEEIDMDELDLDGGRKKHQFNAKLFEDLVKSKFIGGNGEHYDIDGGKKQSESKKDKDDDFFDDCEDEEEEKNSIASIVLSDDDSDYNDSIPSYLRVAQTNSPKKSRKNNKKDTVVSFSYNVADFVKP